MKARIKRKGGKTRIVSPEVALQKAVFGYIKFYGVANLIAFHPFNEGKRAARSEGYYRSLGMLPGVADVVVVLPGGLTRFLELKAEDGDELLSQLTFASSCKRNGVPYAIARTPEEATATLYAWGALIADPLAKRSAA